MSVNQFIGGTLKKIAGAIQENVTVVNNLLATVTGNALDATQGKILNDKIQTNTTSINNVRQLFSDVVVVNQQVVEIRNTVNYASEIQKMQIQAVIADNDFRLSMVHYPANSLEHDGYLGITFDGEYFYFTGRRNGKEVTKVL